MHRALSPAAHIVLLAAACALALPPARANPPPATGGPVLRAELAVPLAAAQLLLQAGKTAEAMAQVRVAEALPALTPPGRQVVARMKGSAALAAKDDASAMQAFQQALDTGTMTAEERQPVLAALVRSAVSLAQPVAVVRWGRQYVQDGGRDTAVHTAIARALQAGGDAAGTAQEMQQVVATLVGAGTPPPEDQLLLLARLQTQLKVEAGYWQTLELLVAHHPKPAYWGDLVARVQGSDNFADRLTLDAYRLMRQTRALRDGSDYSEMARLATRAGLPAEALAVLDEGFARGLLGQGPEAAEHQRLRERATAATAAERGQLAADEVRARASADGAALVILGQALASHGDVTKGTALMAEGLTKGLRTNADDACLRLGALQMQQGRRAEAEQTLRAIRSRDGAAELARLWLLVR